MDHTGIITFRGTPLTLTGTPVAKGDKAPGFSALANDLSPRSLADYAGKVLLISAVPSLDTGVCDMETRRFNQEATRLGADVRILTISCDLPFAQARWCGAAGVDALETLSDHRDLSFGSAYGVVIKELRLLTRAIFVVDRSGTVTYTEIVPEVSHEPNYEAALAAVRAAL
uniref:Thiol peroxidase n=1 Tax=Nitratidesulfovibrio vulgaris (strain DSM 19637 / Miyazaki F) TaxID=883 RepID=B8DNZ1_NITV9